MPGASLRHPKEPFESLFRRYKKAIEKSDLLRELRAREAYEKPSEIRKRQKAAAKKRHEKRMRELEAARNPRARLHPVSSKRRKDKRRKHREGREDE